MAKDKKKQKDSSKAWSVLSLVAALGGATIARKSLTAAWQKSTGKNPPANPADPDVDLWEAVLWAAVSGTVVQLARMLATRRAANYYAKSTGHLPPGLQKDDQDRQGGQGAAQLSPPAPDDARRPPPSRGAAVGVPGAARRAVDQAQSRQMSFFSSASWLRC